MGKVQFIKSARKERKCQKCGKIIEKGMSYYKGVINFHPDIVRCTDCKLQSYEVTTSDYQLAVGDIVYNWKNNNSLDESTPESIAMELEEILDETQDKLDNMPEQLYDSPTGQLLQERIEQLESAIDDLNNIYIDDIKEDVISKCEDFDDERNYDEIIANNDYISEEIKNILKESFNELLSEEIENALVQLEV